MIRQANDKPKWSTPGERNPRERVATPQLSPSQIQDLRWAAAQRRGTARRAFQAEMTLQYCHASARLAERLRGWSRAAGEGGVAERRPGICWLGAQAAWSGRQRWEEKDPEAGSALREWAAAHAHQAPPLRPTVAYSRLTAKAAGEALRAEGSAESQRPSASTRAEGLTRLGYRWRKVSKATPQKKIAATEAIFTKRKKRPREPGSRRRQALAHRR